MKSQPLGTAPFDSSYDVLDTATLQMTDFGGGNNKFYQMELHQDSIGRVRVYSNYGRTGRSGTQEERAFSSLVYGRKEFDKIKREKLRKGYQEVKMASVKVGSDVNKSRILSDDINQVSISKLDTPKISDLAEPVSRLVTRLYDEAGLATRSQLSGSLSTSVENPLGTLTLGQLNTGKEILREVNDYLASRPDLIGSTAPKIVAYSNEFYSAIPQEIPLRPRDTLGRERWLNKYALNRPAILDEKYDLIDLLSDVQGMVKGFETTDVDRRYKEMGTEINWCPHDSECFLSKKHMVESTQSHHHGWRLNVRNVWQIGVKKQIESRHMDTMLRVGNIHELFHGSRPSNILGICKKGLLLRPPGAYVTGSMFGNGLYFADQSTKSSQYSTARFGGGSGSGSSYFMFIAEVALGRVMKYTDSQSWLNKPPSGYDSVAGVKGYRLLHDEFIIYNLKQHQLQYLVEFTQSYK